MQTNANTRNRWVRLRAGLLLTACVAALALPVAWQPATTSPTPGDPTGLVVVAAGWGAWLLTIYLAAGTGVAAATHLAGSRRSWRRLAPRGLRRLVEVAVGASSAAAVCIAPAVAYADAPSPSPAASASPLDWPGLTPAPPPATRALPALHQPVARAVARPSRPQPATPVVVRPGDSLWSLTARRLGPAATPDRVAAAWPRLYAANRRLIGPNPALIHPGQRLVPPTSDGRTSR